MLHNVFANGAHTSRRLDKYRPPGSPFCQIISVFTLQRIREIGIGLVNSSAVNTQSDVHSFKMERKRCPVPYWILERVPVHVALLVLFRTECQESISISLIDRRTSEAKQEDVGQSMAHLAVKVAFLGAMSFIHHNDNI